MESAKNGLDRILTAVDNLRHLSENAKDVPMTEDEKKIITSIDDIYKKFKDSMTMISIQQTQYQLYLNL